MFRKILCWLGQHKWVKHIDKVFWGFDYEYCEHCGKMREDE